MAKLTTGVVRLSYANIASPRTSKKKSTLVYMHKLLFLFLPTTSTARKA